MKTKFITKAKYPITFYVQLCDGTIWQASELTKAEKESCSFTEVARIYKNSAKQQSIKVQLFKLTDEAVFWMVEVDDGDGAMEIMVSTDLKNIDYIGPAQEKCRTWKYPRPAEWPEENPDVINDANLA